MFKLLKRVFTQYFTKLQARLVRAYQSFMVKSGLKFWLRRMGVYQFLFDLKNLINTAKSLAGSRPFWYALYPRSAAVRGSGVKSREIVMLAVSDMRIDPRVQREAQALARAGYYVKIIVPDNSNPRLVDAPLDWGTGIEFVPLPWQAASYVMYFPFLLGDMMLDRAVQERPFAFHCHDLTTAVIGLAAARRVGTRCVCDFHEWWSELPEWDSAKQQFVEPSPMNKKWFKFAERLAMSRADAVITVCDSIAKELPIGVRGSTAPVTVIRNIPDLVSSGESGYESLRECLNLEWDQQLVIYQGGVGPSRNLEAVIDALAYAPQTVLVLRGPAIEYFSDAYRERAVHAGTQDRLFCFGPVPSTDVVAAAAASGAVAGLYTVAPLCLSWKYALPNKLFEYMAAGLPILTADYPEVQKLVDHYGIGIVFDAEDPRSIAAAFNKLAAEPELVSAMRGRLAAALADLDAEREWQKIVDLYDGMAEGCKP